MAARAWGHPSSEDVDDDSEGAISQQVLALEQRQCAELLEIQFGPPVAHVYNPLQYAARPHQCFVHKYGNGTKRVLFLGMNPGPFGMAQNGVPFGDAEAARGWLGITGAVERPASEHPKRPVVGLALERREVSGSRFWGLMEELYSSPQAFFLSCYVHNYCPLCFIAESGRNVTPPTLARADRAALERVCDGCLEQLVRLLRVEWVVGVGKYAEGRARRALRANQDTSVCSIMHPSPINPQANRGWAGQAKAQLAALGLLEVIQPKNTSKHLQS